MLRNLFYTFGCVMFLAVYWAVSYSEYLDYVRYGIM